MDDRTLVALMAAILEAGDRANPGPGALPEPRHYVRRARELLAVQTQWQPSAQPVGAGTDEEDE